MIYIIIIRQSKHSIKLNMNTAYYYALFYVTNFTVIRTDIHFLEKQV